MPLEEMVFGEEISRQEDEASGWTVAHSRKKQRQDFTTRRQPWPQCRGVALITLGGVRVTALARGIGLPPVPGFSRNLPGLNEWAQNVSLALSCSASCQEQATARIQQLERENATLRSELQEIKALVEELRQRERTPEGAVKVQQAEAQPRGGKRKAADPPVDIEKEFSDFKQEIMGVVHEIKEAIAGVSSVIQSLSERLPFMIAPGLSLRLHEELNEAEDIKPSMFVSEKELAYLYSSSSAILP
ncbi:hypothetical protein MRX96_029003 [Rhipicephalus microplus]